ncbi:MAG: Gldg family protein [bacterium]
MTTLSARVAFARPWLAPLGWGLLLMGERILSGWPFASVLSGLGVLALLALAGWSLLPVAGTGAIPEKAGAPSGKRTRFSPLSALPSLLFLLAVAIYFLGRALPATSSWLVDWRALARWGWMLCLLQGAVLFVFLESAGAGRGRDARQSAPRIRRALVAGNGFGLLVLLLVTLNFVFDRLPWEWNLAYFKMTQPSLATQELISGLEEPVEAVAFFPADSPVSPFITSYFQSLAKAAPANRLVFRSVDAHLNPALAESFKARGNGRVIFKKGALTSNVNVGETMERARRALIKLDETVFSRLQTVAIKRLAVYFTVGHGERNEKGQQGLDSSRRLNSFQSLLRSRNFQVKTLGLAEMLGAGIPADASVVVIAGPSLPFQPAEVETLQGYLEEGGRLLVFLEPSRPAGSASVTSSVTSSGPEKPSGDDASRPEKPSASLSVLLAQYGIAFDPVVRGNDRFFFRRFNTKADHTLLGTNRYQPHPSVSQMRTRKKQSALLFLDAGALRKTKAAPGVTVKATILSMPGTWGDRNRNFTFDPGSEKRESPALAMAAERRGQPVARRKRGAKAATGKTGKPPARIFVFADVDVGSDFLLRFRDNRIVLTQVMAWLTGRNRKEVYPASEKDVRMLHAKGDDWLWFYLPVVGIPLLVLGFGNLRIRRLRKPGGAADEA